MLLLSVYSVHVWFSTLGLAGAYAHLSTALLLGGGVEDETAVQANQ